MVRRNDTYRTPGNAGAPLSPRPPARPRATGRQRGSSLIELLASLLFVSILGAMSYSFARAALIGARVLVVKSEAEERTSMALDMMARELRMAGYSAAAPPLAAPLRGVRAAGSDHIEIASDFDGNGTVTDTNELIAYRYNADTHTLQRATGGGSPQPFVRDVPANGLQLSYRGSDGSTLAAGPADVAAADRQRIHRIDLQLSVELPHPDPGVGTPLTATAWTSVCLRNQ